MSEPHTPFAQWHHTRRYKSALTIKDFVGDVVAKIARPADDQQAAQNTIPCTHYLTCELITESLIPAGAKGSKKYEKENGRPENDAHHCVAKMDMNPKSTV